MQGMPCKKVLIAVCCILTKALLDAQFHCFEILFSHSGREIAFRKF